MIAVMGATGQVGSRIARRLIEQGKQVRVLLREQSKAEAWLRLGAEVAIASTSDAAALAQAFRGAGAAFVMLPPVFDPSPGYPESRMATEAVRAALAAARPAQVVALSTIGGQVERDNLLVQLYHWEQSLCTLDLPVVMLRPTWFVENTQWLLSEALEKGILYSHLQPLDKPVPMVAVDDIAAVAAELLTEPLAQSAVVELAGPEDVSPRQIATVLTQLMGRQVQAQAIPRETWEEEFRAAGMKNPKPRMYMLDGFNQGWIRFEGTPRRGQVTIKQALKHLLDRE